MSAQESATGSRDVSARHAPLEDLGRFIREMVRSPQGTGAFWPSSPALAKRIVHLAGVPDAQQVIEIGPGTGAFTLEILSALRPDGQFLAVERNSAFVRHLRNRFPSASIHEGCATQIGAILKEKGIPGVQSLVSGLPWANFDPELQRTILSAIRSVLEPGSVFATFAYFGPHWLPSGRRFRSLLKETFDEVRLSPVEMRNLPPAFVYRCQA
jgi:phospholipid N-methyltransferase